MRAARAIGLLTSALLACAYDRPTLGDAGGDAATDAAPGLPCDDDGDCPSQVCLDRACAPASAVRYVAATGTSDAACSQAEPCATIAQALAVHRTPAIVVIAGGSYPGSVVLNPPDQVEPAFDVWLVGSPAAAHPIVLATDDGTNRDGVELYRGAAHLRHLEVRGSLSNASSAGIWTDTGTTLTLDDVVVTSARSHGVQCNACTLVADRTTFRDCTRLGLQVVSGSVTVRGSQFRNNAGGGAELSADDCAVTSSLFVGNGTDASTFGGASLACVTHRFDGNTLSGNRATSTATVGVRCVSGAAVPLRNNLFDHPGTAAASCSYTYSLFASGFAPLGAGNRIGAAGFAGFGDYHLTPQSAAYGNGTSEGIGPLETDIDREPRIQGRADIGADELP